VTDDTLAKHCFISTQNCSNASHTHVHRSSDAVSHIVGSLCEMIRDNITCSILNLAPTDSMLRSERGIRYAVKISSLGTLHVHKNSERLRRPRTAGLAKLKTIRSSTKLSGQETPSALVDTRPQWLLMFVVHA